MVTIGPSEAATIKDVFDRTFARWGIELPEGAVERGALGEIRHAGWTIRFRVDADPEGPYLEYYATHRMTSDVRVRIRSSGVTEELDAIWESYMFDARVPGDEARARGAYLEHNQRVADELTALGLYPDGDINAYLRTGGDTNPTVVERRPRDP